MPFNEHLIGCPVIATHAWIHPTEDKPSEEWDAVQEKIASHYAIAALPEDRRWVAVQAGGNIGIYPITYAKYFGMVHTFEPECLNLEALMLNENAKLTESERMKLCVHGYGLGSRSERVRMNIAHTRAAARMTRESHGESVDVVKLDSVDLSTCDLIQLDVEGWEYEALLGAQQTIVTHRPVVILEMCHTEVAKIRALMHCMHYCEGYEVSRLDVAFDEVFYPKEWKAPKMRAEAGSIQRAAIKRAYPTKRIWPKEVP